MLIPEKTIQTQTNGHISQNLNIEGPNYSRCLNFWKFWLAPAWPHITLKEHSYMLYESFLIAWETLEHPQSDSESIWDHS